MVEDVSERRMTVIDGRLGAILDGIDAGVTVQDERGALVYANAAAARMAGLAGPAELLAASRNGLFARFEMIDEQGGTISPSDLPARRLLAGGDAPPLVVGFRDLASGEERWSIVRASDLDGATDGRRLIVNTFQDLTPQVRAGRASVAAERQFRDLTDSAPMLVWMAGLERERTFVNAGWLAFTGRTMADELGDGWLSAVHPVDRERCSAALAQAFVDRRQFEIEYRLRRHDASYHWVLDIGAPHIGADGRFLGFIGSAVDIEDRRRAGDLARLIADASVRLDETLELDETVAAAARLAIPELADWCIIDLLEADGTFRRAAAIAADPEGQAILDPIRAIPTELGGGRVGARVAETLQPVLVEDLTDDATLRKETGGNETLAAIIRATEARSAIVAPLVGRGKLLGIMFFAVGPDRVYGKADLSIITELARRAAQAVSNAQLYAAEQAARQAAEASADRMERLQHVTRALVEASSRAAVVELIVSEGRAALGAVGASVVSPARPPSRSGRFLPTRPCRSRSRSGKVDRSGSRISSRRILTIRRLARFSKAPRTARPAPFRSSPTGRRTERSACPSASRRRSTVISARSSPHTPICAPRRSPGSTLPRSVSVSSPTSRPSGRAWRRSCASCPTA